jgi:hypothetical protein
MDVRGQKKTPARGRGWQACRRERPSPAQGGKAGGSKLPDINLSNNKIANKSKFTFCDVFDN